METNRNIDLIQKTLDHIHSDINHWDQSAWHNTSKFNEKTLRWETCETSYCYAGWACVLDGWDMRGSIATKKGKDRVFVRSAAIKSLRITNEEAVILFDSNNSLEMLDDMVSTLVRGENLIGKYHDDRENDSERHY